MKWKQTNNLFNKNRIIYSATDRRNLLNFSKYPLFDLRIEDFA